MEKNIQDQAAEKLTMSMSSLKLQNKSGGFEAVATECFGVAIAKMLIKFCYQNEEFAQAVMSCDKPFVDFVKSIIKSLDRKNPVLSDLDAYLKAVKFYLPAAEVTCSFRISLPEERDMDLIDLDNLNGETQGAIILELFGTEEQ